VHLFMSLCETPLQSLGREVGKLDNETRKHLLADQCPVWAFFVKVNYF